MFLGHRVNLPDFWFASLVKLRNHRIAVKQVLVELKPLLSEEKLLVSIAAGIKMKDLQVSQCAFRDLLTKWIDLYSSFWQAYWCHVSPYDSLHDAPIWFGYVCSLNFRIGLASAELLGWCQTHPQLSDKQRQVAYMVLLSCTLCFMTCSLSITHCQLIFLIKLSVRRVMCWSLFSDKTL